MGIFGKGSPSIDPNSGNTSNGNTSTRNRRNSSNAGTTAPVPVSIVPAPPQGGSFIKPTNNLTTGSSVFGRQQSWSDQLADASLLKGTTTTKMSGTMPFPPVIPVAHNPNILYPSNNNINNVGSSSTNDVKFVHSTMEILENQIKREEAPKKKRTRTSTEQLRILQKAFQTDPMPNSSARAALSKKLGMSTRAVQVWFQNRRAKDKLDAKRNMLGLSGTSSFTYVKGNDSDDEEGHGGNDDEDDFNCEDDEGSVITETSSNSTGKSGDLSNSLKVNGMMGRMAFTSNSSNEFPIKAQRSSSTPNGFFHGGFPNSSISNQQNRFNQMSLGPKTSTAYTGHYSHLSSNNPLCHLFPGETFISDVNEASVDQLYQDLGGAGTIPSPIDDACAVLSSGGQGVSYSGQNSAGLNFTSASSSASASNFFTFGDPFYGGGIIDRTPSVSPVGFGPRSHFYPIGSSSFDFMLPSPHVTNEFNSLDAVQPAAATSISSNNACKGLSGGNVYLTSSISSSNTANSNANRRSFSLPEAHGNLTFQQMQQLENFGLQVFPSPLLSINEEDSSPVSTTTLKAKNDKIVNYSNGNGTSNSSNGASNSSDFLIPFSDFLEGEVIR